jgi:hypothetical protein
MPEAIAAVPPMPESTVPTSRPLGLQVGHRALDGHRQLGELGVDRLRLIAQGLDDCLP